MHSDDDTKTEIPLRALRKKHSAQDEVDAVEVCLVDLSRIRGVAIERGGGAWLEAHARLKSFVHRRFEQGQRAGALAAKEVEKDLADAIAMAREAELRVTEARSMTRSLAVLFANYRRGSVSESDAATAIAGAVSWGSEAVTVIPPRDEDHA